jgi:hypothetical protein
MAIRLDLTIPQGKAWTSERLALVDDDGGPLVVGSRLVRAQVRPSARDVSVLHEWSTALGNISVVSAEVELTDDQGQPYTITTDVIAFLVKPSESAAWTWQAGVYDCELSEPANPDEVVGIVEPSAVEVEGEVTR